MSYDPAHLLEAVDRLALAAGGVILPFYNDGGPTADVLVKSDGSPVTAADHAAEAVIEAGLVELTPGLPVVAEEAMAAGRAPQIASGPFWLVDPLDGTKEFIAHRGTFTVNIALVTEGRPVLGVVYAPALGERYLGGEGLGAWFDAGEGRRAITVRTPPEEGVTVVASRSHGNPERRAAFLKRFRVAAETSIGSSLKFCLVAKGVADVYPRFGPTCEWDTAAGHAVLTAAGGRVETDEGAPLTYGKPGFGNPPFVAYGAVW
ncbi:MAG: 3'(2'),5'-bisphosphate nucleotidase CysQ [Rhodospirillaceae bacterium]|nr:3'(2'),5'-bisphosphate nucleotidase CysQ [Rhodospirillaceae bacterium]